MTGAMRNASDNYLFEPLEATDLALPVGAPFLASESDESELLVRPVKSITWVELSFLARFGGLRSDLSDVWWASEAGTRGNSKGLLMLPAGGTCATAIRAPRS